MNFQESWKLFFGVGVSFKLQISITQQNSYKKRNTTEQSWVISLAMCVAVFFVVVGCWRFIFG